MDLHHSYIDCMGIVVDDSKLSDDVSKKRPHYKANHTEHEWSVVI